MKRRRFLSGRRIIRGRVAGRRVAPRPLWKPIGLVWRKRVTAPRAHAPRGGKRNAGASWSPRFTMHVHLATTFLRHASRGGAVTPPAAIAWRHLQSRLTSILPVNHAPSEIARQRLIERCVRTANTRSHTRHFASLSVVHRILRTHDVPRRLARQRGEVRTAQLGRMAFAFASGPPLAPAVGREPQTWCGQAMMTFALRSPAHVSNAAKQAALVPVKPLRRIELVWRCETDSKAAEPIQHQLSGTSVTAPSSMGASSFQSPDELQSAARSIQQRFLDPALIDRVADDVMGRVERRIRIERERRGV